MGRVGAVKAARDRAQAGFTLFEVVVVLGIATITGALIWQSQPLGSQLALRAAAVGLVGDLRAMQARGIRERDPDRAYGVEFPPEADRYVLVVQAGQVRTPLRVHHLPPGVRITYARFGGTDPSRVLFSGVSLFGAPSGGGTVTFTGRAGSLCVRLMPATGRARVASVDCP